MVGTGGANFSYEGQLVFNGLYTTSVLNPDFEFESIVDDELVDYSKGTSQKPGRGYEVLPFQNLIEGSSDIDHAIRDLLGDIRSFRFMEEQWEQQEVDQGGDVQSLPTLSGMTSFDAYWAFPEYLFIKGNKTQAKRAGELLNQSLSDYIKFQEMSFSPEFLLWIFSKEKNDEVLPKSLSVSMLTDAEIKGTERDRFGREHKVDNSTDITQSAHVLIGVLQQKGLVALEGVYSVGDKLVRARVSKEGRVHVKAEHAIQEANDLERMALSVAFIRRFATLYDYWKSLPGEEKHPPVEFFKDIYEECKRHGVEITFSIDDVIEEYRKKGSMEEYDQYQAGIHEFE